MAILLICSIVLLLVAFSCLAISVLLFYLSHQNTKTMRGWMLEMQKRTEMIVPYFGVVDTQIGNVAQAVGLVKTRVADLEKGRMKDWDRETRTELN